MLLKLFLNQVPNLPKNLVKCSLPHRGGRHRWYDFQMYNALESRSSVWYGGSVLMDNQINDELKILRGVYFKSLTWDLRSPQATNVNTVALGSLRGNFAMQCETITIYSNSASFLAIVREFFLSFLVKISLIHWGGVGNCPPHFPLRTSMNFIYYYVEFCEDNFKFFDENL